MADQALTALAQLGLSPDEIAALQRQGFVSRETRGPGGVVYKLRFRWRQQQIVRCLGSDPQIAAQVQEELARLQAGTRLHRQRAQLVREVTATLRGMKTRLEPLLHETGYRFHGLAIRRRRSRGEVPEDEGSDGSNA